MNSDPDDKSKVEIGGQIYYCLLGSDVIRDGMYLELSESSGEEILEIFYSDQTGFMTLTALKENIPVEAVEWLIEQAKTKLLPKV